MTTEGFIRALRKYATRTMTTIEYQTIMVAAANKLEELQEYIDNMNGDHWVDYVEYYAERCWALEELNEELKQTIAKYEDNSQTAVDKE